MIAYTRKGHRKVVVLPRHAQDSFPADYVNVVIPFTENEGTAISNNRKGHLQTMLKKNLITEQEGEVASAN